MRSFQRSEKGFTLIELILVIGIMGVLGSMGMTTYQDMMIKTRQNEAKSHLIMVYTGMRNFHSEWNQYFGDWDNIGLEIQGTIEYRVGFHVFSPLVSPRSPDEYIGPGVQAGGQAIAVNTNHAGYYCGPGKRDCREAGPTKVCGIWDRRECAWDNDSATGDWFKICSCGFITKGGQSGIRDRWALDQTKTWFHEEVP